MNATRLTSRIPMHMKLVSAEESVLVGEYFDFQPAYLGQFERETNVY